MNKILIGLLMGCVGLVCGCSTMQLTGGSSQQGNGVVLGHVVDTSGGSFIGAKVDLLPAQYDPVRDSEVPDSLTAITDSAGNYAIRPAQGGSYNVEVMLNQGTPGALITGILASTTDTVLVPPAVVRNPGFVRIILPDSADSVDGYFYIPGSTIAALVANDSGVGLLGPVPAGTIPQIIYNVRNSTAAARIMGDSILVEPGDTSTVAFSAWKSSKKLFLNTTSDGAGVAATVTNFPVLVRLGNADFDFSQAKANGEDIRFSNANGSPLAYEIEEWDASQQQAAIWVSVDTVRGNTADQYISMYWGNADAASESSGAAVFDTALGFDGVWHLGETSGPLFDASPDHFDGTPSDTPPVASAGYIGGCQQFNGTSNFIQMLGTASGKMDFPEQGTYSVSAWVYADTLDTLFRRIVCKNNYQYKLQIDQFDDWSFAEYENAAGFDLTNSPATAQAWVHLVGVRSGGSQYLYANGVCVNSTITPQAYSAARDTTSNVTIGRSAQTPPGDPCFFKGKIDEVRIEGVARSADWIKLCYMNQKVPDALVEFKQ